MEIRSARAGDVPNPDDMGDALLMFNELLDLLNATERALYTDTFFSGTLTAALQPHTIGVTADSPTFAISVARPTQIKAANLLITAATPTTRIPLTLRDGQWWMDVRARLVSSAIPTDLYYDPGWPNGSIYLWPVPTTAYGLELNFSTLLASVALTDTFTLPPGYQAALRLTLAEAIAGMWGQAIGPDLARRAREARGAVWSENDTIPGVIPDGGLTLGARGGGFNYLTGGVI